LPAIAASIAPSAISKSFQDGYIVFDVEARVAIEANRMAASVTGASPVDIARIFQLAISFPARNGVRFSFF
jgi:hypothetical protein